MLCVLQIINCKLLTQHNLFSSRAFFKSGVNVIGVFPETLTFLMAMGDKCVLYSWHLDCINIMQKQVIPEEILNVYLILL